MRFEFKFYFSERSLVKFETIRNLGTPFRLFVSGWNWMEVEDEFEREVENLNRITFPNKSLYKALYIMKHSSGKSKRSILNANV